MLINERTNERTNVSGIAAMPSRIWMLLLGMSLASMAWSLQGEELHATIDQMRDSKHHKYTKSHKKFRFFDKDDTDFITREEFEVGLKQLGYKSSTKKLDHIMKELDLDGDGKVIFSEFMRPTAKKYKEELELEQGADTDRAFEHFDSDFDGRIDMVEFANGLSHMPGMQEISQSDVENFFTEYADIGGDGYLTYEELETIDPEKIVIKA